MANANGVWIKTHVYRENNWLKADVHMVTMGEPTVFTVGVDMAKIVRAVKAYHALQLHADNGSVVSGEDDEISGCVGCELDTDDIGDDQSGQYGLIGYDDDDIGSLFGKVVKAVKHPKKTIKKAGKIAVRAVTKPRASIKSLAKTVKSVAKSKLVKQIASTAKKVIKSKVTAGIISTMAVVYPPVGIPAAAAYAAANMALAAVERGNAIRKSAVGMLQQAKKTGIKPFISDTTKKLLATAVSQDKTARAKIDAIIQTAKFSEDPRKKLEAAKMVKVFEVVAKNRVKVRAIPTAAKKAAGKNRVKGMVVNERGGIAFGTFDENPLGRGAALLYRPGKSIPGSFTKIGGCIGCSMGSNPWPNLR